MVPVASLGDYPRNDSGAAQLFADRHQDTARYCHGIGWLVWNGSRWRRDTTVDVTQLMIQLSRDVQVEASRLEGLERDAFTKYALALGNRSRIEAALKLAESNLLLRVRPEQLDSDPMLIGVENGAVDLRSGTFRSSDRGGLITRSTGTRWDPGASCPTWLKFLHDVTEGDRELIEFLHCAIGYSLSGEMREQVFFFIHGNGSNGKSVFIDTLNALLGDYVHRASGDFFDRRQDRNKGPELAELPGARLLLASETTEGSRLDERLLKDLTGGETMRAEPKYHGGFQFRPIAKVWISGNHRPAISGTDEGIWRRVRLVPFEARFDESKRDPRMGEHLRRELPGILRWAVEGFQAWQAGGLPRPERVRLAIAGYRSDEDILGQFISERIERVGDESFVEKDAVYKQYQFWAERQGIRHPITRQQFTRELKRRDFCEHDKKWRGIRLISG